MAKELVMDVETVSLVMDRVSKADAHFVSYDGAKLVGPDAIIDSIAALDISAIRKAALAAYAADRRYAIETGGVVVNGHPIKTDRPAQTSVVGAYNAALADPNFTTFWKCANGGFIQITAAQVIAITQAITAHVSSCFAAEAAVVSGINAGTITTRAQIDAALTV